MIGEEGELVVYRSEDGRTHVQLRAVEGTVWLTQAQIAQLYDTSVSNIAHIMRRVLHEGEVSQATVDSESKVQQEGSRAVRREVKIYNLDMVLAVGYRVTSPQAVHFRQWATTVLREYLVKGFVLDDRRLKDPRGTDYFDELLDRGATRPPRTWASPRGTATGSARRTSRSRRTTSPSPRCPSSTG